MLRLGAPGLGSLTVADLGILGAVALAMAPIAIAKYGALRSFDNARPRDDRFYDDPFRNRALGAHKNGLEGLPFFIGAVILAEMHAAPQARVDGLALGYLGLRVAFIVLYLSDQPSFRSLVWALGFAVNIAIFCTPLTV
jgi:uncharacterized MAPEG superfamily protein